LDALFEARLALLLPQSLQFIHDKPCDVGEASEFREVLAQISRQLNRLPE
jgi:hypothetical protein